MFINKQNRAGSFAASSETLRQLEYAGYWLPKQIYRLLNFLEIRAPKS